jgi:putative hydrolase of the HAD superfamily
VVGENGYMTARRSVRGLILDYGGVLTWPQEAASVEEMVGYLGVDGDLFRRIYRRNRAAFDSGSVTPEQYWRGVVEGCGLDSAGVDVEPLIDLDVRSWTQLNEAMVQFVRDVRHRVHRLAILSNMTESTLVWMREHLAWLALLDACVFSCELGVNKPDAAIYGECARRLGVEASECLFVDDSAENVQGARKVGMAAIRFEGVAPFLAELGRYELVR